MLSAWSPLGTRLKGEGEKEGKLARERGLPRSGAAMPGSGMLCGSQEVAFSCPGEKLSGRCSP